MTTTLMPVFVTDDALFELNEPDPPLSPAQRVTGSLGVIVAMIAATAVIIALMVSVSDARHATDTARGQRDAVSAKLQTVQSDLDTTITQAAADRSKLAGVQSQLTTAQTQLATWQNVGVLAKRCIDRLFDASQVLVMGNIYASQTAINNLKGVCDGLGPMLAGKTI